MFETECLVCDTWIQAGVHFLQGQTDCSFDSLGQVDFQMLSRAQQIQLKVSEHGRGEVCHVLYLLYTVPPSPPVMNLMNLIFFLMSKCLHYINMCVLYVAYCMFYVFIMPLKTSRIFFFFFFFFFAR